jgi:type IV pilus assembly protein PilO
MALGPKNQRDQIMVVIAMMAILLALPYWYYVYSPKRTLLVDQRDHVERLEKANDRAEQEMAKGNVSKLRAEAALYERNLEMMRQLVPTSNEVPALLEQVSTAARRVGLDLAGVQPQPVIEGDEFDTYRYKVTVIGPYHKLAEFLANVGSLTRIIAPINLSLAAAGGPAAGAVATKPGEAKLDCRFDIQTYVAKTVEARAPQAAGRKS